MTDVAEALLEEPAAIADVSYDEQYRLSRSEIDAVHLAGAQKRFRELRPKIAMLDRLAQEQEIDEIRTLDDIAPLLLPHTAYKSYQLSSIERSRYDRMTKWLQGLTTADLSAVDTKGVDSIDGWIDALDVGSDVRVFHTSGTSGKLSFLPRTTGVWEQVVRGAAQAVREWSGPDSGPDQLAGGMPIIFPSYRYGASAAIRSAEVRRRLTGLPDEDFLYLYPDARMSADVASLAGRLRLAETRGEQGSLEISPALLKRRDEVLASERERPAQMQRFFEEAQERFGGRDVYIAAIWTVLYDWASGGLSRGYRNVFGSGSGCHTGGGTKGVALPSNWREQVFEFLGFDSVFEHFGTSELLGVSVMCDTGHYHFPVSVVPFVLDPVTGTPLERKDPQHGRLAMLDTISTCYWAGLVTGDEVTVQGWDEACPCGRVGPYLVPPIRRYSEAQGGDDKITCAGAPEAHDRTLAALAALSD